MQAFLIRGLPVSPNGRIQPMYGCLRLLEELGDDYYFHIL
jgi:hypothetical protein